MPILTLLKKNEKNSCI